MTKANTNQVGTRRRASACLIVCLRRSSNRLLRINTLATADTPNEVLTITASATAVGHTAIVAKEDAILGV